MFAEREVLRRLALVHLGKTGAGAGQNFGLDGGLFALGHRGLGGGERLTEAVEPLGLGRTAGRRRFKPALQSAAAPRAEQDRGAFADACGISLALPIDLHAVLLAAGSSVHTDAL
jgi:hypothetical protein